MRVCMTGWRALARKRRWRATMMCNGRCDRCVASGGGVGRVWIAVESLYQHGWRWERIFPRWTRWRDRREAVLVIDEAHATGSVGAGVAEVAGRS